MKRLVCCVVVALLMLGILTGCDSGLTKITQSSNNGLTAPSSQSTASQSASQKTWEIVSKGFAFDNVQYAKGTVNNKVAIFKQGDKFGLVDFNGKIVQPAKYIQLELSEPDYGSQTTMLCGYDQDWNGFLFNADGSVSDVQKNAWGYESSPYVFLRDGFVTVWNQMDGEIGGNYESYRSCWHPVYDMMGNISLYPYPVVPIQQIKGYHEDEMEGYVPDFVSEKYALFDYGSGALLTDFVYDDIANIGFVEGITAVKKGEKWAYINDKGQEITPFIYDTVSVGTDGRWDSVRMYAYTNGYVVVRQGDRYGIIDQNGATVVEPTLEGASLVNSDGQFWCKKDGKWYVAEIK